MSADNSLTYLDDLLRGSNAADAISMFLDDLLIANVDTGRPGTCSPCEDKPIYNNYLASDQQLTSRLVMGASQPVQTVLFVIENALRQLHVSHPPIYTLTIHAHALTST